MNIMSASLIKYIFITQPKNEPGVFSIYESADPNACVKDTKFIIPFITYRYIDMIQRFLASNAVSYTQNTCAHKDQRFVTGYKFVTHNQCVDIHKLYTYLSPATIDVVLNINSQMNAINNEFTRRIDNFNGLDILTKSNENLKNGYDELAKLYKEILHGQNVSIADYQKIMKSISDMEYLLLDTQTESLTDLQNEFDDKIRTVNEFVSASDKKLVDIIHDIKNISASNERHYNDHERIIGEMLEVNTNTETKLNDIINKLTVIMDDMSIIKHRIDVLEKRPFINPNYLEEIDSPAPSATADEVQVEPVELVEPVIVEEVPETKLDETVEEVIDGISDKDIEEALKPISNTEISYKGWFSWN